MPLLALALVLAALIVLRYYPFEWDPPRWVENDVRWSESGALQFGDHNYAKTRETPPWLESARRDGLTIDMEVKPASLAMDRPASIMMLARDYWHTDIAAAQDDSDLLIWLRRPGSSENGDPPFLVRDVFRPDQWTAIIVTIDERIRVLVDGEQRMEEPLTADSLAEWSGGVLVLGDEVRGGGPWRGEIRRAQVSTTDGSVDYLRSGQLSIPVTYLYAPEHLAPFPPRSTLEWIILGGHLLSAAVIGGLIMTIRRPTPRPVTAWGATVGIAVLLAAGKLLFHGRHASIGDVVVAILGAAVGVGIVGVVQTRRRPRVVQHAAEAAG